MKYHLLIFFILFACNIFSQPKIENLIIITTDGFRWQEVFKGMDSSIASRKKFNQGKSADIFNKYWATTLNERRQKLLPFLWSTIVNNGQIYGNRELNSKVNVVNHSRASYPGYSELLCGYVDRKINSNSYPDNPNENLLTFLNKQHTFKNQVGMYGAWKTLGRIINKSQCGFPVVTSFDTVAGSNLTQKQVLINKMLTESSSPWGEEECLDIFTHYSAMEYLISHRPKVLYIAYGETDEWAHSRNYWLYLNAANRVDKWIGEVWNFIQEDSVYKNKTALLITVDHGRGVKKKWVSHSRYVPHSDETWFALVAPGLLPAKGEISNSPQLYQTQLAQTLAELLGLKFTANHRVAESVLSIMK